MPHIAGPFPEKCQFCQRRSLRVFCNLSDGALERFDEIAVGVSFPGKAMLFEEGDPADSIYVICDGQVKLSTISKDGRTMILRIAGPGDVLGLSATVANLPHEVTAETIAPANLKSVSREEFLELLENYTEVGRNTAKTLAKDYHEVFLDARRLALSGSAAGRLAQLLIEWAHTAACGKPELRFTMALTHEELASMAGASRETVTRLLSQFERDRLIARRGSSLTIVNPSGLAELAQ